MQPISPQRVAGRRILTDRELNTEEIPEGTSMLCPYCPHEEWVSPEDPDCSQGLLIEHMQRWHDFDPYDLAKLPGVLQGILVVTSTPPTGRGTGWCAPSP